ncbi:MAG: hypothetical protein QOG30_2268, partial [Acidimicrobiaceae bacterium]
YRTSWGGLVTSDGREAEVAIAPVALRPGWTSELEWRARFAHRTLASALPDNLRLDGYSTHLNIEVDDDDVVAAGRLFVKRFAPAMMLLLDRSTSPGLLVRPRCGRLELGGEYCQGDQLRAAATFAAAGGLACAAAVRSREARRHLPRAVRSRVRPSNIRAGWYVDRRAFGPDLYRDGRATELRWGPGRRWTAQAHLHETWDCARPLMEPLLDESELLLVDRVIDGTIAIPLEGEANLSADSLGPYDRNPFERVVLPRQRPGYTVEPMSIAWDAVAFRLRGVRRGIACIPRAALEQFLDDLDAGRLDEQIERFLASPPQGRVLQASDQTGSSGLFDEIASPDAIVPPERIPGRGVLGSAGGGTPADSRRDKNRRARGPKRALVAAGVVVAVLLVGGGVVLATRGDSKKTSVSAGGTPAGAPAATGADFAGKYNVTFTVTKTKTGADFVTIAPADGTVISGQILLVTCNADGCSMEFDTSSPPRPEGQAFGFPHPVTGDANHLAGRLLSEPQGGQCQTLNAVVLSADITLQRDAAGAITGFSGTNDITHRDALFQDNGNGNTCATYDVTYSLVGTRVP